MDTINLARAGMKKGEDNGYLYESADGNYNRKQEMERYMDFRKQKRFMEERKVRRKHVIICHSAEEMNRKTDALMEQGYLVEKEMGVQPVQTICFPIYKIKFWK